VAEEQVLWGSIDCIPYAEDPEPRIPVVNIAIIEDYWINDLDPDGLTELAARLRAQADRLENEIRPRLIAARTDWAHHQHAQQPTALRQSAPLSDDDRAAPEQPAAAGPEGNPARSS
jgi:hypothetical protein